MGPHQYGDALYAVVWPPSRSPAKYMVYKSTDQGATWASQDEANAPAIESKGGGIIGSYAPNVAFDGTLLYILKFNAAHDPVFAVFDCSTDTFDSESAAGSSGTGGILYFAWPITTNKIRAMYYTGTQRVIADYTPSTDLWSSTDTWPNDKNPSVSVAIDSGGVMHIGYTYAATPKKIYYAQMATDRSVSGETEVYEAVTYGPTVQPRGVIFDGDFWIPAKIDGREYEDNGGNNWEIPLIVQVDDYDGTPVGSEYLATDDSLELGLSYTYDISENLCLTVGDGTLRLWALPIIIYSTTGPGGDPPGNWEEIPSQWYFVDMKLRHWDWNGSSFAGPTVAHDEFTDPTWPASGVRDREYFGLSSYGLTAGFGLGCDMDDGSDFTYHVVAQYGGAPLAYFGIGKAAAVAADAYALFL
jgi:hypothetical protein